jgi:EAL domain-containing protein (putative c-di-GMP-specific phosphodiesterase class I)
MDDFGTGYSSLRYLQRFPFDRVKIDKSFIDRLCETEKSTAIVRAVTGLCDALGMSTTAEGVETEEQLQVLASNGCGEAQGYLFGRPCPTGDISALLERLSQTAVALAGL